MTFPANDTLAISNGELPKSNPGGAWPPTSPMQTCATALSRNASASSTEPTMMMCDAPLANATAAVVKARNTSMIATAPLACVAPSSRLRIATCTLFARRSAVHLPDQLRPAVQHRQCLLRRLRRQADADAHRAEIAITLQQVRVLLHVEQRERARRL